MASLRAKLKLCDAEIQHYVAALETENRRCARKVGKLQAANTALNDRITFLVEQNQENKRINLAKFFSEIRERAEKFKPGKPPKSQKE